MLGQILRPCSTLQISIFYFLICDIQSTAALLVNHGETKLISRAAIDLSPDVSALVEVSQGGSSAVVATTEALRVVAVSQWFAFVFGAFALVFAIALHWYNERRSARISALLGRGQAECRSVSADAPDGVNTGSLVHAQGILKAESTLQHPHFPEISLSGCVKLQSTVEAFEWVQITRTPRCKTPRTPRAVSFSTQWVTKHRDANAFTEPGPENPRLPRDLNLGTFTAVSDRVRLGQFLLPEGMVRKLRQFKPCSSGMLPEKLSACGLTFVPRSDGYYYARPKGDLSPLRGGDSEQVAQVGDIRVKFMCIQDGFSATAVALQSETNGEETFRPYRAVPRCCQSDTWWKEQLVEEGERPFKEPPSALLCEGGRVSSCCCCPCNLVITCTEQEVITEEIFYIAEQPEPMETPFMAARPRSMLRAFAWRLVGWVTGFSGALLFLIWLQALTGLDLVKYGLSHLIVAAITGGGLWLSVAACAWVSYSPAMALFWLFIDVLVLASPVVVAMKHS
mmetsp:Transcript_54119/g.128866  ORF Transcript_54119/g.128866 Transcript_54119/m.128866 type:complete len:509 (+) Transcript_54119:119-1645(+)